jgi:hypothetical protein
MYVTHRRNTYKGLGREENTWETETYRSKNNINPLVPELNALCDVQETGI